MFKQIDGKYFRFSVTSFIIQSNIFVDNCRNVVNVDSEFVNIWIVIYIFFMYLSIE